MLQTFWTLVEWSIKNVLKVDSTATSEGAPGYNFTLGIVLAI